jgi:hypothetical protein
MISSSSVASADSFEELILAQDLNAPVPAHPGIVTGEPKTGFAGACCRGRAHQTLGSPAWENELI